MTREFAVDSLHVAIHADRKAMGAAAAAHVADYLAGLLDQADSARIVVGSAPSQDEFFTSLTAPPNLDKVDWSRVEVFHMDEYVGLTAAHAQSFRAYQIQHFAGKLPLKAFHPIQGESPDPDAECRRLERLLRERPIDLVCYGIGENGHLAFNDPPVADFEDPRLVKVVEMDAVCRQQQVNDGCFPSLDAVPRRAITLTLPVFINAAMLSGVVPAATKARAVRDTLSGPVSTACPASLVRKHPRAWLHLEPDSAALL